MKHKVILLTGASGKLGTEICNSKKDNKIIGVYRNKKDSNCDYVINKCIISQTKEIIDEAISVWGKVDVLINNAVIYGNNNCDLDNFDNVFRSTVFAPYALSFNLYNVWKKTPKLNKLRNRQIINIGSTTSKHRYENQILYSSSKTALDQLVWHIEPYFNKIGINTNLVIPCSFPYNVSYDRIISVVNDLLNKRINAKQFILEKDKTLKRKLGK